MEMKSKRFVGYLLTAFSAAILSAFFIPRGVPNGSSPGLLSSLSSAYLRQWPDLEVNWRSILAAVIGFLGSGFGTVGGVGGGGIFVPVLTLIVGFDAKSAAALSKCMIMGASASSVWYNIRVAHPTKDVPIIDYDLALLFQPMLLLGITVGVSLSVVFPYWLVTVLIIILFLGTSSRSFCKGVQMWEQETIFNREEEKCRQESLPMSNGGEACTPLIMKKEKSAMEIIRVNLRWKRIAVLLLLWVCFLLLQVTKTNATICSPFFWFINILQFPVAICVFAWEAVKLYREGKARRMAGNFEYVSEASIEWTGPQLLFCALCGLLGGTVGGLLGSGGGFILGPLLLEIGVIPQVASATATFVMLFSSSLSVVEFYFLGRFPIPYAVYLTSVSLMAGFWGQFFVRRLVQVLRRASIIVFILSSVIFTSALIMGIVGIESSIRMIRNHEYMGFLSFCSE